MNEARVFSFNSLKVLVVLILIVLAASGCAGVPMQSLPFARTEANRLNEHGLEAVRRGDPKAALEAFAETYRLYAAVEYHPGMVTALVNTARIATGQGKTVLAHQALGNAFKLLEFTPGLAVEVFFEQSRLLLREGKVADAATWVERAMAASGESTKGRVTNLLAEIRMREGKVALAGDLAKTAMYFAKVADDRREIANSLRLLGEIAFSEGRHTESEINFSNALDYDKELGLSLKIVADLQWLARAAEAAGQSDKARIFWERAGNVSLGAGDHESVVVSLERLAILHEQVGDTTAAASVRLQIQKLSER